MTNTKIHPTAVIYEGAEIDDTVEIGPYCVIYSNVKIGKGTKLLSHVVISGDTTIGENNTIYPFASIGSAPQDLKFHGESSKLIIGNNNIIRECVTMNPGTNGGGLVTTVGDNCLFMLSTHVAHDCKVGNNVIMANNASLAGHVIVEDFAIIGGLVGIHQRVRVGEHAIIGFMSAVEKDVLPYASVKGDRAYINGINIVGLKRRSFDRNEISSLLELYGHLFENNESNFETRVTEAREKFKDSKAATKVLDFMENDRSRSICQPKNRFDS